MGVDKSLLAFGEFDSLAQYQYERLKPYFKHIYISTKDSNKFHFNASFIIDDNKEVYAPTVAIKSIFQYIKNNSFLAIAVDTPFITIDSISKLISLHNSNIDITTTIFKGKIQPMFTIYSDKIIPIINNMIKNNQHKLNSMIKNSYYQTLELKCEKELLNLNYYEEYKTALSY